MPKYIKPFPALVPVAPISEDGFRLGKPHPGETYLFDSVAQEHMKIAGTSIEFYSLDLVNTTVDPLYGEAIDRVYRGPFKLTGQIEWPDSLPEMREEGLRLSIVVRAWIARKEFDDWKVPYPNEGDVIRVWNIPYFNSASVDGETVPNSGYYFAVVDVDDDGHIFDNADFVGFVLDLRRNTEFTPERKILPP